MTLLHELIGHRPRDRAEVDNRGARRVQGGLADRRRFDLLQLRP